MKITAKVNSQYKLHETFVETNNVGKEIMIPPQHDGYGSYVNGGELLLLSLATCFCNDLYREAAKKDMKIDGVEVQCTGEFGANGEPGFNFTYAVKVTSDAPQEEIDALIRHTDEVAEIHNTLRKGIEIKLN